MADEDVIGPNGGGCEGRRSAEEIHPGVNGAGVAGTEGIGTDGIGTEGIGTDGDVGGMIPLPPPERTFSSDNAAGVPPEVLAAVEAANTGHAMGYGSDPWTEGAVAALRGLFGPGIEVLFTFGGTGANLVALGSLLHRYQGVICAVGAHVNVDECAGPEMVLGAKMLTLPTGDGKLRPADLHRWLDDLGQVHHAQAGAVLLSQATECGTVYGPAEVAALAEAAHARDLYLFLDGARLANAVAATGASARSLTVDAGVDAWVVGGTKAGALFGEAVCFARPELAARAPYVRKAAGQLASKHRFIAAQFEALLTDDLWVRLAAGANARAARLAGALEGVRGVRLSRPPEVNSVFAHLPVEAVAPLQGWSPFWVWDPGPPGSPTAEVRWMTAFDTTDEDVDRFAAGVAWAVRRWGEGG